MLEDVAIKTRISQAHKDTRWKPYWKRGLSKIPASAHHCCSAGRRNQVSTCRKQIQARSHLDVCGKPSTSLALSPKTQQEKIESQTVNRRSASVSAWLCARLRSLNIFLERCCRGLKESVGYGYIRLLWSPLFGCFERRQSNSPRLGVPAEIHSARYRCSGSLGATGEGLRAHEPRLLQAP